MAKKFFIFVFFIFLSVNLFSIAPTAKNANKAKRYYSTLERIAENFDGDKFSEKPSTEDFFSVGRMIHFVEVLKPVFEDLYDNGVEGISLENVKEINEAYEGFELELKSYLEIIFYSFDNFIFEMIKDELPNELKKLSADKLMKLSLREFNKIGSSSKESFDEISELDFNEMKKKIPKYKNLSFNEFMNLSVGEFFRTMFSSDEMQKEIGFNLNDIEKWREEYERGLSYDKIEFD